MPKSGLALAALTLSGPACAPTGQPIGLDAPVDAGGTPGTGGPAHAGAAGSDGGAGATGLPVRCPVPSFVNTVAHWSFDEDLSGGRVRDLARGHDGDLHGAAWSSVPGRDGCGQALHFAAGNEDTYVEVPDSVEFDLTQGSIGFFLFVGRCDQGVEFGGLVSRDTTGTGDGHLQIRLSDRCATNGVIATSEPDCSSITTDYGCHITVRLQASGASYYLTSPDPLPLERWVHVGVSFGDSLELYLDGALAEALPAPGIGTAGNDLTLLLGASNSNSRPGRYLQDTTLDEIRISAAQRDFDTLVPSR